MDIVALQETRLLETGSVRERDFTLFWQGKPPDEVREHGVGFAVMNRLLGSITPPAEGTERILSLRLQTSAGPVSLISAYAPTLASTAEAIDMFYKDISAAIWRIPDREPLFIAGDFNARVGVDHNSWPTCLGQFGTGKMNENGQHLLELCCHHGLYVSNTICNTKPLHRVSWRHPRSEHWHQLDLILTRRVDLSSIKITRSYQSADCDTDHSLVCNNVKLRAKSLHRTRKEDRLHQQNTRSKKSGGVCARAGGFSPWLTHCKCPRPMGTLQRCCLQRRHVHLWQKDHQVSWFEAHSEEMTPVIEAKRKALTAYKANPSEQNLQILRAAHSKVQQCARQYANNYWLQLAPRFRSQLTLATSRRCMMASSRHWAQRKLAPLKSATGEVIQDREQQMERWVEHYTELYARENVITEDALNAIDCLPELEELDREPTIDELSEALDSLASGKAPGKDGITAEVLKCCKETLITELHEILCLCWSEGDVPQDMRDANVVTLYKSKGDRSDCKNHRGIFLLSIVGKVFTRVVLERL